MNIIEDNNSGWSISGCLLLGVVLFGIILMGVMLLVLTITGVTWLIAIFLFVTKVGLTLMSETLVDVRVLWIISMGLNYGGIHKWV